MAFRVPDYMFSRVQDITVEFLQSQNIRALILDVDNTLTRPHSQQTAPEVLAWLQKMQTSGIPMVIASNNKRVRVEPYANRLGLPCYARSCKPLPFGLWRAKKQMRLPASAIAVVGDQIYTDVLAARSAGMRAVLLEPMEIEPGWFFRKKRAWEKRPIRRYREKHPEI